MLPLHSKLIGTTVLLRRIRLSYRDRAKSAASALWPLLLLSAVIVSNFTISAAATEVVATRLDGSTIAGKLQGWNDGQITIATSDGEQQVSQKQLLSLHWSRPSQVDGRIQDPLGIAELTDGTLIPIAALQTAGETALLELAQPADRDAAKVSLAAKQLWAVRFRPLDDSLAKQWDEIRRLDVATDILVVVKRDGKSLDYLEGVLGNITSDKVEFTLDGELNRVDRGKVAAVVYHRSKPNPADDRSITIRGRSGLKVAAAKIQIAGATAALTAAGGATFDWPLDDLELADFSAGKLVFLSDLEPAAQNWTPLIGWPSGIAFASQFGRPRRDESAFGGPLALLGETNLNASNPSGGRREFSKGLALRSRTEIIYRLPAGFSRFTALAGIDPLISTSGVVRLAVVVDDIPLLETVVSSGTSPLPIDIPIRNAKRLKIVVDFGDNLDTGDWLNLCDAKMVK